MLADVLYLHNATKKGLSGHVFYFIDFLLPFCKNWKWELLLIFKEAGFPPLLIRTMLAQPAWLSG